MSFDHLGRVQQPVFASNNSNNQGVSAVSIMVIEGFEFRSGIGHGSSVFCFLDKS